jgi:hypothetical protein
MSRREGQIFEVTATGLRMRDGRFIGEVEVFIFCKAGVQRLGRSPSRFFLQNSGAALTQPINVHISIIRANMRVNLPDSELSSGYDGVRGSASNYMIKSRQAAAWVR